MSKSQIISVFLFGLPLLSLEQNNDLFLHVQSFISESMRFLRNTKICTFHVPFFFFPSCMPLFNVFFSYRMLFSK